MWAKTNSKDNLVQLLLRTGLAAVFAYASIAAFINPQDWIGYLPQFARDMFSGNTLLHIFSLGELVLAVWLLSGKYVKYAAAVCVIALSGIVLTNLKLLPITFRDIGLIFAALALMFSKQDD